MSCTNCLRRSAAVSLLILAGIARAETPSPVTLDAVSAEQAKLEQEQLAAGHEQRTLTDAMTEFRKSAELVKYRSGEWELPAYLYKPQGQGPFPAILWNHGSEKEPRAQPELARFYTEHGYIFFVPIRHGHVPAPGDYIVDLQRQVSEREKDLEKVRQEHVKFHELYNHDVVAALDWMKQQPTIDPRRIFVSGVSYGGIQTLLTAEKGAGARGFIAFAPAAMSFANVALRQRLVEAAKNSKRPVLLLQAQNDYSVGPSEILAPVLKEKGAPSHSTIYPAFGATNQHGHGAFACWSLGIQQWGAEVLQFLDAAPPAP
jgi:dienelactone hydrolase